MPRKGSGLCLGVFFLLIACCTLHASPILEGGWGLLRHANVLLNRFTPRFGGAMAPVVGHMHGVLQLRPFTTTVHHTQKSTEREWARFRFLQEIGDAWQTVPFSQLGERLDEIGRLNPYTHATLLGPVLTLPAFRQRQSIKRLIAHPELALQASERQRPWVLMGGLRLLGQTTQWDEKGMVERLVYLIEGSGELALNLRLMVEAYAQDAALARLIPDEEWRLIINAVREVFNRCAWREEGAHREGGSLDMAYWPSGLREDLFIQGIQSENPTLARLAFKPRFSGIPSIWSSLSSRLFGRPDYAVLAHVINNDYVDRPLIAWAAEKAKDSKALHLIDAGVFLSKEGSASAATHSIELSEDEDD